MTTTDISIFSLAVGLLLLLVPLYFFRLFKTSLVKATLIATARMVVQLFLIGLYLKYLFLWNNPLINILWVLVMVVVAASTAIRRTGLKPRVLFLPVATGFLSAAILVGMYFLVFVLGLKILSTRAISFPSWAFSWAICSVSTSFRSPLSMTA